MNTERNRTSPTRMGSLIGGFLFAYAVIGFLCVYRVSVVSFPVSTT